VRIAERRVAKEIAVLDPRDDGHDESIVVSLRLLGIDPDSVVDYEVLAGGASGASAFRIRFTTCDRVLKVTLPRAPGHLLQAARREVQFYKRLASTIPIQVPEMVASHTSHANGARLLLDYHAPAPPASAWTKEQFVEFAAMLGRFHARFWGKGSELAKLSWLRRIDRIDQADILRAEANWRRMATEGRFNSILMDRRFDFILRVLRSIRGAGFARPSMPTTLCHGDCHTGNVLRDAGDGMLLADWQEIGLGCGPEDLSFLVQRASFSGGVVPIEEMINAYQSTVSSSLSTTIPIQEIRRVIDIAELRTMLLHWPVFLLGAPEGKVVDMLDRIQLLEARLVTSSKRRT
jgi:aminoglycoside phosphotransferase (APT) family kinase protein